MGFGTKNVCISPFLQNSIVNKNINSSVTNNIKQINNLTLFVDSVSLFEVPFLGTRVGKERTTCHGTDPYPTKASVWQQAGQNIPLRFLFMPFNCAFFRGTELHTNELNTHLWVTGFLLPIFIHQNNVLWKRLVVKF